MHHKPPNGANPFILLFICPSKHKEGRTLCRNLETVPGCTTMGGFSNSKNELRRVPKKTSCWSFLPQI